MRRTRALRAFLAGMSLLPALAGGAGIDEGAARKAFDALERNCTRDNGALWGVSLCGTVVIVDRNTREGIASDGWTGILPRREILANTAFDWKGGRASMVLWPLPQDEGERDRLLLHERFHAVQDVAGFPSSAPAGNDHLDTLDGRYLMRLEMRALRAALSAGSRRTAGRALRDALAFRQARFDAFPDAQESEEALDRNEGLASYTAVRLFTTDMARRIAAASAALREGEGSSALGRSYAYATGPAWGLLLDETRPGWRKELAGGTEWQRLWTGQIASAVAQAARRYQGPALLAEERKYDEQRKARLASYNARFIDGRVLRIPLHNMNLQFDPYDTRPFPGHGTVYEHITVADDWGKITTEEGALISSDFKTLTVFTALPGSTQTAPPWTITLEKGWKTGAGPRPGDLVVERIRE